eukprot:m.132610 g.132610  ORF g.132610 m.132610 type:complete len:458 (-) comp17504_c0_seq6:2361-3734(-)
MCRVSSALVAMCLFLIHVVHGRTNARLSENHVHPKNETNSAQPRMVAYVNCACGFGFEKLQHNAWSYDVCGADPNPGENTVLGWEQAKSSPVTHYVLSFLSFSGSDIQTDAGSIWADGGGSRTNFTLTRSISAAMAMAKSNDKKIMLSIGGETGSRNFLDYWSAKGSTSEERIDAMHSDMSAAIAQFESHNRGVTVDGVDIDIELGGGYTMDGSKWVATREIIEAVPEELLTAFVPQVGNGLCAAPVEADLHAFGFTPVDVLGGQCMSPAASGAPWSLALMDAVVKRSDGSPKLDWLGIQYYNAASAVCCGGGLNETESVFSVVQNYKNLALGWPEVTVEDMENASSPWAPYRWWPGPWAGFDGVGADRLVLGKPACHGCAGSNYIDAGIMKSLIAAVRHSLGDSGESFGGILFWDLCRLFGTSGGFCVGDACLPSWGSEDGVLHGLQELANEINST